MRTGDTMQPCPLWKKALRSTHSTGQDLQSLVGRLTLPGATDQPIASMLYHSSNTAKSRTRSIHSESHQALACLLINPPSMSQRQCQRGGAA